MKYPGSIEQYPTKKQYPRWVIPTGYCLPNTQLFNSVKQGSLNTSVYTIKYTSLIFKDLWIPSRYSISYSRRPYCTLPSCDLERYSCFITVCMCMYTHTYIQHTQAPMACAKIHSLNLYSPKRGEKKMDFSCLQLQNEIWWFVFFLIKQPSSCSIFPNLCILHLLQ